MSAHSKRVTYSIIFLILFTGCSGTATPTTISALSTALPALETQTPTLPTIASRTLNYQVLMNGFEANSPVDNGEMALPEEAASPEKSTYSTTFEGRLELLGEATNGSFKNIRGGEELLSEEKHLPEFDFEFVQSGGYLIPVRRGLIITTHPSWNYILEPGRVWKEDSDQGYLRASFPFSLTPKNGNSAFHGVMTFLFNDQGISKVWYQITQETSASLRMDLWGLLDARYHPGTVANADKIREDFEQELANRLPTRPIEQLTKDYPGLDIAAFKRKVTPEHMTTYGLVVNGIHYRGGCTTRYGNYPYCENIRMPSFSTAKSAFVSLALMRLAQKYGPQVASQLVKDYVPEAADSPGDWSQVTFDNILDMATGNFRTSAFMVDEEGRIFDEFFGVETYADKIRIAFDWPNSAKPGTTWVYRSSDTLIAVAALQNYLRSQEGETADLFDFVVREVYQPIGLGQGVFSTLRTSENNWRGQPIGAMGMWWIPDDIAKLGGFLNVSHGAINNEQILHLALLSSALQQDANDRGVDNPGGKYNNAFWADRYTSSDGYDCTFYVPYMAGYSGIIVALMPNGVTYYYFSDNREFDWSEVVQEVNKIKPYCANQ